MVELNIIYVERLINIRRNIQGGRRGHPGIEDGIHIGDELNRACIVMLSAALQSYIEEVFESCMKDKFSITEENIERLKKSWNRWGNPSSSNITRLFMRLGEVDIFEGLSWQGMSTNKLKENIDKLNSLRNQIAHGRGDLNLNGEPYSLRAQGVESLKNVMLNFSERFEAHVRGTIID